MVDHNHCQCPTSMRIDKGVHPTHSKSNNRGATVRLLEARGEIYCLPSVFSAPLFALVPIYL